MEAQINEGDRVRSTEIIWDIFGKPTPPGQLGTIGGHYHSFGGYIIKWDDGSWSELDGCSWELAETPQVEA